LVNSRTIHHNNNNNNNGGGVIVKESAAVTAPWRWREKEVEMQSLQGRLTEREREIGRLKEKLRDLTKKLRQEQQLYNSKVCTMHDEKHFIIINLESIRNLYSSSRTERNGTSYRKDHESWKDSSS